MPSEISSRRAPIALPKTGFEHANASKTPIPKPSTMLGKTRN